MNRIRLTSDLAASLIFILIGAIAFGGALRYRVGTATNMGPGWFPAALAIVLFLLGVGSAIQTIIKNNGETLEPVPVTPLIAVLSGLVVFGILLDRFGLVPATAALVVIACYDRIFSRPIEVLVIATILTVGSAVLFIYFLGLPITLW